MIDLIIDQRRRDLGGFEVGRVLPFAERRMVGPFIFFDHIGPVDFAPGIPRTIDVRPHPHIGLSTVTYLFGGEIMHRDSLATQVAVRPGEVNWMTAGRGITHSERFEKARAQGDYVHGIQSWVALPNAAEETEPGFTHYDREALPTVTEGGLSLRLIAGEGLGLKSAVRTHSPIFYAHLDAARAGLVLPLPRTEELAVYIVSGSLEAGAQRYGAGKMLVLAPGAAPALRTAEPSTVMILGGAPVGERFIEWNFVSSSHERIEQAKADWRAGRMKLPDFDRDEFIPLPSA